MPEQEAASPFTDIRVTLLNKDSLKGLASCKVAGLVCLTGLRIVTGARGLFVAMPARKDNEGEYHDIFFPANREVADELRRLVMEKYERALESATAAEAANGG